MTIILDGKSLSQSTEIELAERVELIKKKIKRVPVLATILVGEDPASATYVRMKGNACERIGMDSLKVKLPSNTSTAELLKEISKLNKNPDVHGILLQHPVPEQINERQCFDAIALEKDVDGVTCLGFGKMSMGEPALWLMHASWHYATFEKLQDRDLWKTCCSCWTKSDLRKTHGFDVAK